MNRRCFLKWTGLGLASLAFPSPGRAAGTLRGTKPNILFLFADDQCFEAIHALGCDEIETPNLDRLVKEGVTFTRAYNMGSWTGAVCVASRTMLNTGRWLWNAHAVDRTLSQETQAGRLWSQMLRAAGYETYFTGKWHVKIDPETIFDHVIHVRPGMPNDTPQGYNRPLEGRPDPWAPWDPQFGGHWKGGRHWSEVLGDDATAYLRQAATRDKPFFMYLAFNAPHDPRQSPKEYVDKYPLEKVKVPSNFLAEYPYKDAIGCGKGLRDEKLAPFPRTEYAVKVHRQEYYAIITHMDAQIGRILDALEASGKAEDTVVFFTADHGLAVGHHGFMGKQNLYDHSVRVPLIVCGPGIQAGGRVEAPVYLQDIMATTLDLAGAERPDHVEFRSLLGFLEEPGQMGYQSVEKRTGTETGPCCHSRESGNPRFACRVHTTRRAWTPDQVRGDTFSTGCYGFIYGAYLNLQRMVFDGRFKLLYYPTIDTWRLYDLQNDPLEMNDLAADEAHAPHLQRMQRLLIRAMKAADDPLSLPVPAAPD